MKTDKKLAELYAQINALHPRTIDFGGVSLLVDQSGASIYRSQDFWQLFHSPLFRQIESALQPNIVVDVGANVGFSTVLFSLVFPRARLVAIEPNQDLVEIIKTNCRNNGVHNCQIVNAVAGDGSADECQFQINTRLSVDSRVSGLQEGYQSVTVRQVSLDQLLETEVAGKSVFVKIDTQGYEKAVLAGAKRMLNAAREYIVLMEFAPRWLTEAGIDPGKFLYELIDQFTVCEAPPRSMFRKLTLDEVIGRNLASPDVPDFLAYVAKLDRNGNGWCDVLLTRKPPAR